VRGEIWYPIEHVRGKQENNCSFLFLVG